MLNKPFVLCHNIHFPFSSHDAFFWSLFSSVFLFLSLLLSLPILCVVQGNKNAKTFGITLQSMANALCLLLALLCYSL